MAPAPPSSASSAWPSWPRVSGAIAGVWTGEPSPAARGTTTRAGNVVRGAAPSGSCRLPPPPAAVATSPTVRCPPRVPARRTAGLIDLMLGRQHARRLVGAAEVVDGGLGQVHVGIGLLGQAQAQLHHLGRLVATWGLWPSPPNRMTRRRRRTRSGQLCPRPGSADTAAEWNPCPPAAGPHCGDRMPNVSCRTHDAHAGLGCHNGRARRPLRTEPRP